ncbi:hypothetical protein CPB86DRAFT_128013 [Serendipita vermifera]|nr:hypothetical protein CPB86DRAFT_128013 [Serendipita vermifera]
MSQKPLESPLESSFVEVNSETHAPTFESQIETTFQRLKVILEEERTLRQRLDDLFRKQKLQAEEELKRAKEGLEHIEHDQLRMRGELSKNEDSGNGGTSVAMAGSLDHIISGGPSTVATGSIESKKQPKSLPPPGYTSAGDPPPSLPGDNHTGTGSRRGAPHKAEPAKPTTGFAFGGPLPPKPSDVRFGFGNWGKQAESS